jgi:hypothetical protein
MTKGSHNEGDINVVSMDTSLPSVPRRRTRKRKRRSTRTRARSTRRGSKDMPMSVKSGTQVMKMMSPRRKAWLL